MLSLFFIVYHAMICTTTVERFINIDINFYYDRITRHGRWRNPNVRGSLALLSSTEPEAADRSHWSAECRSARAAPATHGERHRAVRCSCPTYVYTVLNMNKLYGFPLQLCSFPKIIETKPLIIIITINIVILRGIRFYINESSFSC